MPRKKHRNPKIPSGNIADARRLASQIATAFTLIGLLSSLEPGQCLRVDLVKAK